MKPSTGLLSAFTGMLSAIDRIRCPPSNGMFPRQRRCRIDQHQRSQLDRLYQSVVDDLDTLVRAVGIRAA